MDIVPTLEQFERLGWRGSLFGYHWYFLAPPPPLPERLIAHEPRFDAEIVVEVGTERRLEVETVSAQTPPIAHRSGTTAVP